MVLLIDNYDSFVYNVYQMMSELGATVEVKRNDDVTVSDVRYRKFRGIVISPGPGVPSAAGVSEEMIREFGGELPILGICLGHQAIGEVYGGRVVRNDAIVHGKTSRLIHNGRGLYAGLAPNAEVGRYHSLVVERSSLPECLEVTSELEDGTVMGVRHRELEVEGVQFHPESILTPDGRLIMQNFLKRL